MNSTSLGLDTLPAVRRRGFITDDDFVTIDLVFSYVMLAISLVGVATNSINIKTFVSMGLGDGVTVTLMGLATSDLGFTFFATVFSSSSIVASIEVQQDLNHLPIHPRSVFRIYNGGIAVMFYIVTCMVTTFMAIARCMCVAMPFQFKEYFTKSRSIFAVIVSYLISMVLSGSLMSQLGVQRKFDPIVNKTRIVLWTSAKRSGIKNVVTLIQTVAINFVSSLIVGVCVLIMANTLKQSHRFRHSMAMSAKGKVIGQRKEKSEMDDPKLSGKELQVVKQVILICIIYSLSTVPLLFFAVYRVVEDEFDLDRRLHNFYYTFTNILFALQLVNSATSFLVYYFYNSKFRSHCFLK